MNCIVARGLQESQYAGTTFFLPLPSMYGYSTLYPEGKETCDFISSLLRLTNFPQHNSTDCKSWEVVPCMYLCVLCTQLYASSLQYLYVDSYVYKHSGITVKVYFLSFLTLHT